MKNNTPVKYAFFIAVTPNYLSWLNALLNSMEKRRLSEIADFTVFVLHHDGCNPKYLKAIETAFSFDVFPVEVLREEVPAPAETNRVEFIKRARFFYIRRLAPGFDVSCLLDCDMFLVSQDFIKLFDLVHGTSQLIGCNERFKWQIGRDYLDGSLAPIFEPSEKLYHMTCSVPIIFDYAAWSDVFDAYCELCFTGKVKKGDQLHGIVDIFCCNICVQKCRRQNDIIVFPMETMCQVHKRHLNPLTFIQVENGYWYTYSGDPVYSIQGRWNTGAEFVEGGLRYLKEHNSEKVYNNFSGKIRKSLEAIQQEWFDLNFRTVLNLDRFEEYKPLFDIFNRRDHG